MHIVWDPFSVDLLFLSRFCNNIAVTFSVAILLSRLVSSPQSIFFLFYWSCSLVWRHYAMTSGYVCSSRFYILVLIRHIFQTPIYVEYSHILTKTCYLLLLSSGSILDLDIRSNINSRRTYFNLIPEPSNYFLILSIFTEKTSFEVIYLASVVTRETNKLVACMSDVQFWL